MGEKITKEELMNLPMFRLIDGNKFFDFDGYHNLYEWCRTDGKAYGLIGTALGCAELVLLFVERPLRYLVQEKRRFVLRFISGYDYALHPTINWIAMIEP